MKQILTVVLLMHAISGLAQRVPYADSLLLDGQYTEVIRWADREKTTNNSAWTIAVMTRKAEAYVRLGRFEEAETLLASLTSSGTDSESKAAVDIAFGSLYLNEGLYEKSEDKLESALRILASSTTSDLYLESEALSYLGNLRRATGEYAQAEEFLLRSLAQREKLFGNNSEWIAASYNDLGLVHGQSDPDKALSFYEKALGIYQTLHPHAHPKIAIALTNIGFAYGSLELYGDATTNLEEALRIWESIYHDAHTTKAFLNLSLGEIYRKLKNFNSATAYIEKSISLYQRSAGNKHPDLSAACNALGNVMVEQGKPGKALEWYQRALTSNISSFDDQNINHTPRMQGYYNGRTLLNTMLYRAQALEALYLARTLRMTDLVKARDALMSCDTLVSQLRQQIANESDKLALGAIAAQVYQNGVRICVEAAEVALQKRDWYQQAFYFSEKGKSAVLLEGISEVKAKAFARIPQPLLEEERQMRAALALATTQLAKKPSSEEEQLVREHLYQTQRQYEQFISRLENDFPQYYNLKYNAAAPTVPELQNHLDGNTAIVSYLIDEDHKSIYIFVVTRKNYRVYQRPLPADLDRSITGLRNGLVFNAKEPYRKSAEALSGLLLPRVPGSIKHLVIIPTGRLGMIPFEVLLTASYKEEKIPDYLIRKYSIRYEFAASLILQKSKPAPTRQAILLCAPVKFSEDDLNDLPGSEAEVQAIDALFSRHQYERTTLTYARATEDELRGTQLNQYKYLHFATHGIVDEIHPELSRIYLSGGDANDGLLYSGEIYNMELNADLVTLSACQTGLGKISRGEGVIGLSRALAYAGARRMIVSLWKVSDASTSLMMQSFYDNLLDHGDMLPSGDLRTAKIKMIESEKYAAPYYWAPFVMIGY
ncbi:CHAT domain-containing tetratricopeptide repeat protein [Chryseolinea sp. T2]|uniref:CHAT domain-containing tetratricopeptide repeat protein n=1 Tax=Chryseolinea sp. T2 TaxID=3129255 RepID=UPI0030779B10